MAPGGKGANQALAAARMGAHTALIGAVGNDAAADAALSLLHGSAVNLDGVDTVEGPTGLAVITVNPDGENTIIVVPGANASITPFKVKNLPHQDSQLVVAQGEIPAPAVDVLAHATTGRFILNLAPVIPVSSSTLQKADPLIVNEHEGRLALQILGGADGISDDFEVVGALQDRGVRSVVMTRGPRGAIVSEGDKPVSIASPVIVAVDTTGAGDAFVGALVARLAEGENLTDAARIAVRVGAFACTRAGAQRSYPREDDRLPEHT